MAAEESGGGGLPAESSQETSSVELGTLYGGPAPTTTPSGPTALQSGMQRVAGLYDLTQKANLDLIAKGLTYLGAAVPVAGLAGNVMRVAVNPTEENLGRTLVNLGMSSALGPVAPLGNLLAGAVQPLSRVVGNFRESIGQPRTGTSPELAAVLESRAPGPGPGGFDLTTRDALAALLQRLAGLPTPLLQRPSTPPLAFQAPPLIEERG